MKLWPKKKLKTFELQGKIHCNENAQIVVLDLKETLEGRLCELNWFGLILDHVDHKYKELFSGKKKQSLKVNFRLPREFGRLEVETKNFSTQVYREVVEGEEMLSVTLNLDENPQVEKIRDFIVYRNRRFAKHQSKRRVSLFTRFKKVLLWTIMIIPLLLLLWIGATYFVDSF